MPKLTIEILKREAQAFSSAESLHSEKSLFGITDGKAVGTYLEHKFKKHLKAQYNFEEGNSANGIDFPGLQVDMKVTSINQPQSSCPFKSARQKIYGLGYSLLIFVYEKTDSRKSKTATLNISQTLFLNPDRTADFHATKNIIDILSNEGNEADLMAFMFDSYLFVDEIKARKLADEILSNPPTLGFLITSNDLRLRLRYFGMLEQAGNASDVLIYRAG